jgi:tRNA (cmo5U34)-methyltransferase
MSETARFDQVAGTWDEDAGRVAMARAVAGAIAEEVPLTPPMHLLDFGCGTGLLSVALRPAVGRLTGADTSAGMLDVFKSKVDALGLSGVTAIHLTDRRSLDAAGPFDAIVSSMALHHVRDVPALLATFRGLLPTGGHLALADLDVEDGSFHPAEITDVHHLGFRREVLRAQLGAAGFESIRDRTAHVHRRRGREYPIFLISARAA